MVVVCLGGGMLGVADCGTVEAQRLMCTRYESEIPFRY